MVEPSDHRILVTGARGQIGSDLVTRLRELYGQDSVIASDVQGQGDVPSPFLHLDVLDQLGLHQAISEHSITTIYNLAAILSAHGEKDPDLCERVNLGGLQNVLDASREYGCRVFSPSSIAVFGPDSRPVAKQETPLNPTTKYGFTKKEGEKRERLQGSLRLRRDWSSRSALAATSPASMSARTSRPRLVLGWINADFHVQRHILQHFSRSTRKSSSRKQICKILQSFSEFCEVCGIFFTFFQKISLQFVQILQKFYRISQNLVD